MAVDALNKIYVITVGKVWAIQWQGLNLPMVCLWKYGYSTAGQRSGTSVTVAADCVIFADRPLLAPFHYIAITKNQNIPNCGAPSGVCLQQGAASGSVDPCNSFNYGNDIAIVLGTGSQNGQVRRFTVSTCTRAAANARPSVCLLPPGDRATSEIAPPRHRRRGVVQSYRHGLGFFESERNCEGGGDAHLRGDPGWGFHAEEYLGTVKGAGDEEREISDIGGGCVVRSSPGSGVVAGWGEAAPFTCADLVGRTYRVLIPSK